MKKIDRKTDDPAGAAVLEFWDALMRKAFDTGFNADRIGIVPKTAMQRKPPHGSTCTQCGVCCMVKLCDLGKHVFGDQQAPCPALVQDRDDPHKYHCGLILLSTGELKSAAATLIRSGDGCDARFNGEPINHTFNNRLDMQDADPKQMSLVERARKLWGMRK
jgi:hypothetical protein